MNIGEINGQETSGDIARLEVAACESPVAELDEVLAQRSPGPHSRRCVICGRDSNRRRRVFLSFYRTIGDSDDGEVWEFRGGFGVHVCSRCRLMQNVKALLVFGLCLSLCLALLRLVYVISTKTEWHPLWYFSLGVLAVGIPLILCLNYDMFVAAARFAKLGKSTDPRFSILQAHGYVISVDFHLRDVRDQDDVQGVFSFHQKADTEGFKNDVQRRISVIRYGIHHEWVVHQIYEWLGDFDMAGDAGAFSSGLEAAKRLAKQSERITNELGKKATSGFSGFSDEQVCFGVAVLAVSAVLIGALIVGVGDVLAWVGKKWKDDSVDISCVLLVLGVVVWAVKAFIKERRKGSGR